MNTMGLQIRAGRTFFLPTPGISEIEHLWIALTDPDGNPEKVVVANLTSRKSDSDTTVVLDTGDHPFIQHETIVRYSDANFALVKAIQNAIRSGASRFHQDCDDDLLELIQAGLLNSPFTPKRIKNYCKAYFEF